MGNGIGAVYVINSHRAGSLNLFARQFTESIRSQGYTARVAPATDGVQILFPKAKGNKAVSTGIISRKFEAFRRLKKRKVKGVIDDVPGRSTVRVLIRTK